MATRCRGAGPTLQTPSCGVAAIWVFDGADLTGNEICFIGSGAVYLDRFPRPSLCNQTTCWTRNWKQAVRSYWPGAQRGYFHGSDSQDEHFEAGGPSTNAGLIARDAILLALT